MISVWNGETRMYSVVAHQSYGRAGRRSQQQSQQQQSQSSQRGENVEGQDPAGGCKDSASNVKRRHHHHRHRLSLTARLLNYIKRRFNPDQGMLCTTIYTHIVFLCSHAYSKIEHKVFSTS